MSGVSIARIIRSKCYCMGGAMDLTSAAFSLDQIIDGFGPTTKPGLFLLCEATHLRDLPVLPMWFDDSLPREDK